MKKSGLIKAQAGDGKQRFYCSKACPRRSAPQKTNGHPYAEAPRPAQAIPLA